MRVIPVAFVALFAITAAEPAFAGKLTTLHSFCTDTACSDGSQPHQIVLDSRGALVGPTFTGQNDTLDGTLFQLQPKGQNLKVLHTFCSKVKRHCLDGEFAFAAPTMDAHGNLFGATEHGGAKDDGVVCEMSPTRNGYKFKTIYSFCTVRGCPDGKGSDTAFAIDAAGNLYGTTFGGGAHHGGVLFELSPNAGAWTYKVLYDFCAQRHCADGKSPIGGVTYAGASAGIPYDGVSPLYGTADQGGTKDGNGVAYQLTPGESGWSEKVLYTFCRRSQCQDGSQPADYGTLALDGAGNVYGVAEHGGVNGNGIIYKLTPTDSGEWSETVLQELCSGSGCGSQWVLANPTFDAQGNLIGTTSNTLYKLDMTGAQPALSTLYTFCNLANCADGSDAEAGVVIAPSGEIYGATVSGGTAGNGTLFEYKP